VEHPQAAPVPGAHEGRPDRGVPERLRQILAEEEITFQRTKTWKESPDPLREEKLARIEWLLEHERETTFAFDEFGPLAIKPEGGSCWASKPRPQRLRANYHKPHGTKQLSPGTRSEATASMAGSNRGRVLSPPFGHSRPSGHRSPTTGPSTSSSTT
jgi:hypothetical protein